MAEDTDTTAPAVPAENASQPKVETTASPEEETLPLEEPPKSPSEEKSSVENEVVAKPDEPEEPTQPPAPILTTSGKKRPPYKYDPAKVTLRFIFANRDGLAVTIECKPADTVGEVKGALLSVWPDGTSTSLLAYSSSLHARNVLTPIPFFFLCRIA